MSFHESEMRYRWNGIEPTLGPGVYIAPGAHVMGDVRLGADVSIWFGAVLRGDVATIRVGDESNVQDGSILHVTKDSPLTIGRRVVIGHSVTIHGATLGDEILVGMGATILDYAVIGNRCLIGAGALVSPKTVIPEGMLVLGAPAKAVRPLRDAELRMILDGADNYKRYKEIFRTELVPLDPPEGWREPSAGTRRGPGPERLGVA